MSVSGTNPFGQIKTGGHDSNATQAVVVTHVDNIAIDTGVYQQPLNTHSQITGPVEIVVPSDTPFAQDMLLSDELLAKGATSRNLLTAQNKVDDAFISTLAPEIQEHARSRAKAMENDAIANNPQSSCFTRPRLTTRQLIAGVVGSAVLTGAGLGTVLSLTDPLDFGSDGSTQFGVAMGVTAAVVCCVAQYCLKV